MKELSNYLISKGFKPVKGEAIAFNDAVIEFFIDEEGVYNLKVQQFDNVNRCDEDINDLIDECNFDEEGDYGDGNIAFYEELLGLNDEDEDEDDEFDKMIENFMSDCKFSIDDVVIVKGYEGKAFRVVGIGRFEDEFIYSLINEADSEDYIEAYEEDMSEYKQQNTQAKQLIGGMLKGLVDELLDEYNDKMSLHMMFGDYEYYERCEEIKKELSKIKL